MLFEKNDIKEENIYEPARTAVKKNEIAEAQRLYKRVLEKDPASWEANFYLAYCSAMLCKIAEIQNAAIRLSNFEDTVLELIKNNITETEERKRAISEIYKKILGLSQMMYDAAEKYHDSMNEYQKSCYKTKTKENLRAVCGMLYNFGDYLNGVFGEELAKEFSALSWAEAIKLSQCANAKYKEAFFEKDILASYAEKIKKYDSSYELPEEKPVTLLGKIKNKLTFLQK